MLPFKKQQAKHSNTIGYNKKEPWGDLPYFDLLLSKYNLDCIYLLLLSKMHWIGSYLLQVAVHKVVQRKIPTVYKHNYSLVVGFNTVM